MRTVPFRLMSPSKCHAERSEASRQEIPFTSFEDRLRCAQNDMNNPGLVSRHKPAEVEGRDRDVVADRDSVALVTGDVMHGARNADFSVASLLRIDTDRWRSVVAHGDLFRYLYS